MLKSSKNAQSSRDRTSAHATKPKQHRLNVKVTACLSALFGPQSTVSCLHLETNQWSTAEKTTAAAQLHRTDVIQGRTERPYPQREGTKQFGCWKPMTVQIDKRGNEPLKQSTEKTLQNTIDLLYIWYQSLNRLESKTG